MKKLLIIILGVTAAACTRTLTYNQAMDKNESLDSIELREDAQFLVEAKSLSLLIESLAQMGSERGYSADVQNFANRVHEEQMDMNDRIKKLASSKKIKVPTVMSDDHNDDLEKVRDADREDFDKEFVNAVEEAYEDSIQLYESQATAASTDEIRVFAAEFLSKMRTLEKEADEIEDDLM